MRLTQLEKAVDLYHEVYRSWQQEGRENRRFGRALKVWQHRSRKWQESGGTALKRGLRISEQQVTLDDEEKVEVARELSHYLEEARIRRHSRHSEDADPTEKMLTIALARELAIETVLILNPHILLHKPVIQRAIDDTPLSTMAPLEPGMSPMTKPLWARPWPMQLLLICRIWRRNLPRT